MDNLLVRLDGKGRKQRIVPFSVALRTAMYRHIQENELTSHDRMFSTATGTGLDRRNALRNVKHLCRHLGFESPHERCTHSGKRSRSIICAEGGAPSISRSLSDIPRWR